MGETSETNPMKLGVRGLGGSLGLTRGNELQISVVMEQGGWTGSKNQTENKI